MRAHRFLIPLAALLATLPLLLHGPSCGHDFDFHLLSWLEASTQLIHGQYPHWAYTPAYNAGEPRFLFYPPLSWLLGGLLGIVLPALHLSWNAVPAAYTWLCLTLAGFTAFRLAGRYAAPRPALLVATLYLANPYLLFCAYERTAYGELLAAAWFPLLLLAAFAPRPRVLAIAIPIALLWLTNAPAAVMGCYALAVLTAVRLLEPNRRIRAAITVAGTTLGLALSAFYLLPAAYERRFIQSELATVEGMQPVDSTLFHRMTPPTADNLYHDQVVHSASLLALLLGGLLVLLLVFKGVEVAAKYAGKGQKKRPNYLLPSVVLTLLIGFLLTPWSLPLWTHIPQLAYLQFPWRLCALLAPLLIVPAAERLGSLPTLSKYLLLTTPAAAVLLSLPAYSSFAQSCDAEDSVPARVGLFHSPLGTEATDEYTPSDADQDQLTPHNPPFWLLANTQDINTGAPGRPAPGSSDAAFPRAAGQAPQTLTVSTGAPEILVLNRRAYPAWQVLLNGRPAQQLERNDGLIAVALPPGEDTVTLTFRRTADRTLGLAISLPALLCAGMLFRRRRGPQSGR